LGNRLARLGYAAPKKYVKQNKDLIRFLASSLQKPFIYSMKHNEEQWQGFRLAVHAKLTDERLSTMPTELATACRHVTPLTSHTAQRTAVESQCCFGSFTCSQTRHVTRAHV